MGALITTVHVHDYPAGESNIFGPGDDVPEWAAKQMGAHCFEDGKHPLGEAKAERPAGTPPPKAGKGSAVAEWAAYAAEKGVEVAAGATRDAIVQAIVDAGHPVDAE